MQHGRGDVFGRDEPRKQRRVGGQVFGAVVQARGEHRLVLGNAAFRRPFRRQKRDAQAVRAGEPRKNIENFLKTV